MPSFVIESKSAVLAASLVLAIACGERRGGEPAASSPVNPAGQAARLTPGACGYWETTPPESLPSCGHRLRSSDDSTLTLAGECGYRQTQALDSLSACLARLDRAAQNCPVKDAWRLRMAGGAERRAEWRRCGPPEPEWRGDSAIYPTDYLLLRADTAAVDPVIWGQTNAEEEGLSGLERVRAADFDGDGTDELFLTNRVYGTGAIFETCALTDDRGRLRCWSGPDFGAASRALRAGESFRKGWIPVQGPNQPPGSAPTGSRSLWYFTPIYADSDVNCCSSLGAAFWLEARPDSGQFRTALLLRTVEDTTGRVVSYDTIPLP